MIGILDKIDDICGRILLVLSGAAVVALMLLATGNVVLRIFHAPYRGTYEIVSFLGAIGVAFALASTQRKKGNIVVDILSSRYPEPVKRLIDALSAAISAVFFGIVAWQILSGGRGSWPRARCRRRSRSSTTPLSSAWRRVSASSR